MLDLDGGDGGGQLLRSALTLSMLSGRAFDLRNVRGDRSTPGLRPQHLASVDIAAEVCDADVEGAGEGSERVRFDPGEPSPGEYAVEVSTAGSVTLVCDVLVPLAARLDGPLRARVGGGTDVRWSPPADYLDRVKLPALRALGYPASLSVDRRGFYPAGGGEVTLTVAPGDPGPVERAVRGAPAGASVHAAASEDLADADVADRLAAAATGLREAGWSVESRTATLASARSTGAVLVASLEYGGGRVGVSALGEPGVRAETVADRVVADARAFDRTDAAVDPHLADQLLLPMAVAGGRVRVPRVTDHVATSVDLLRAFGVTVDVDGRTVAVPRGGTLTIPR